MASSTMVIKVKYGDTLRRFNARVDENDQLDLDMGGLRFKIYSLFNFQLDADITMTYVDEDGDIVTLVDDEDLRDAMKQNMKFLRIDVHDKTDKSEKSYAKSSGSSTPVRYPLPDITPEPIRELISRVPRDLTPNALGPGFADLVDCFSKMGMSYLLQAGGVSGVKNDSSEKPLAPSANDMKDDGKSETILKSTTEESSSKNSRAKDAVNVTKDVGMSNPPQNAPVDLNVLPADSNPSGPTPINVTPVGASLHTAEERKESEKGTSGQVKGKSLGCGGSTSSAIPALNVNDMSNNHFNQCPFSETPIVNDSAPVAYRRLHPFKRNHSEAMGGMFHTGVRCDGCGCHPIIGPRFKSIVKADYDLCRICFSSIVNVAEYIRIDHPLSYRHPRPFKGMHEQPPWLGPSALPKILRNCGAKPGRPKLDSRFVLDVNVMDGTLMAPSTPFTKIWRMRNNGGLIWPKGTQLMWIGGDRFSKSDSVEIEIPAHGVLAENELDIAVDFTAPESPGRYISYWRMASPSGQKFGQRVWVLIQVDTSLKDSFFESFQGLNLNLPPENVVNFPEQMNFPQQHVGSDFVQPSSSNSVKEPAIPIPVKQPENEQDLNFPINDSLLVGHSIPAPTAPTAPVASATVSYPTVDQSAPVPTAQVASSTVTYPTVDIFEPAPPSPRSSPVVTLPTSSEGTSSENPVEDTLLKELEDMGFKQANLNKEILRRNEYNLEQSVDDLCEVAEWDPILEELQEMGFSDTEMNKKLLAKNNGSIKRVVMDLINGDKL
ncbi:putative PB1 domain, Zinc finger, ZZ-type, Next to BRCA1, central domain-containing protein [Rosa chinensis]|uniref:Putative PB1 domain, Zinc finger, ZZ-type, Next to BRCA1, central domain-containing protein n=1 Tax=Rosa chinensis TaxID=74649 RepID=A0A2P6P5L9_ROSCH|nr:protein JOKA2 [Rosa chinensis]PRQ17216.1 putative PB1 domain, Zinc finger, ZZ-type, Next to BRCA1, central domain-containing protein [Rosa chinensis]